MTEEARCLFLTLPNLQKYPISDGEWHSIATKIEKMLVETTGLKYKVMLFNTEVKFITPKDVADLIRSLKKMQKDVSKL